MAIPLPIGKRDREVWPPGDRDGGFSKPASPVCDSVDAAITLCNCPSYAGDFLVKRVREPDGWQVWMRRATARGARHPGDYEFLPDGDRRAKRRAAGSGRLFITEV